MNDTPSASENPTSLTEDQRVGHYIDMWKQSVEVQQHFNDIEWRIRGLALTVATFALGAAGWAAKDGSEVGPISLGAIVILVGLILWYAFYFVDRAWYHPLLKAAVNQGTLIENEIRKSLPAARMTQAITDGSAYETSWLIQKLSRKPSPMRSDDKLVWFYKVGAASLAIVAIALQVSALVSDPRTTPSNEVVVHVDTGKPDGHEKP